MVHNLFLIFLFPFQFFLFINFFLSLKITELVNDLCKICIKKVHKLDNAIVCDICNVWVHTRCNKLDKKDYKMFKDDQDKSFYCLHCMKDIIPFSRLTDND